MDGKSNRRDKAVFSNFCGVVWALPYTASLFFVLFCFVLFCFFGFSLENIYVRKSYVAVQHQGKKGRTLRSKRLVKVIPR